MTWRSEYRPTLPVLHWITRRGMGRSPIGPLPSRPDGASVVVVLAGQDAHLVLGARPEDDRLRDAAHHADGTRHAVVVQALVVEPVAGNEVVRGREPRERRMRPV